MARTKSYDYAAIAAFNAGHDPRLSQAKRFILAQAQFGCSLGTFQRAVSKGPSDRRTVSSFGSKPLTGRTSSMPAFDHPAVVEGRTMFPHQVAAPGLHKTVLKSGFFNSKIGARVVKGLWAGFPIYTLTLEERATCPSSCRHWRSCYLNNMPDSVRYREGDALEWHVEREVAGLELRHRNGFAIRLHIGGDFYSVGYVQLWRTLLERHAALHVFGYTARVDVDNDIIARSLATLVKQYWPRFAVRFSDGATDHWTTVSIEYPGHAPAGAIVCPEQLGQTESCSTCGLCWTTDKPIAFITH